MRKTIWIALAAAVVLACPGAQARETQINVDLIGGYGILATTVIDARAYETSTTRNERAAHDSSFLRPGPVAGLGMTFRPRDTFVHFLYGFDFLVSRMTGQFKGHFSSTLREYYYEKTARLDTGQFDLLAGVGFGRAPFVPYIMAGLGIATSNLKFDGVAGQEASGVVLNVVAGGDYYVLKWMSVGLQFRFSDMMGLRYFYSADKYHTVRFETRAYPLLAAAKVGFHF